MRKAEQLTPDKIMKAAEELFAISGYGSTSVRDICKKTGINVSTIYYHFGSKEGLLKHIFKERLASLEEFPLWKIDQADAEQNLHEFVHIIWGNMMRYPHFTSICLQILATYSESIFLNYVRQIRNVNVQTLFQIIEKGEDSGSFKAQLDRQALQMWVTGYALSLLESQRKTADTELDHPNEGLERSLILEQYLRQSLK